MRVFLAVLLFLNVSRLVGQLDRGIGAWTSHLPYQQGISVTQDEETVYYATPQSIFSIDKEDGTTRFLSKVEGLSDVGVRLVRYDLTYDQLFVIYQDGNIDVITGGEVINIPNIKLNTSITGGRGINDIFFDESTFAYLATDFGMVALDRVSYSFGTTVITGLSVQQIDGDDQYLYAATSEGVYSIDLMAGSNISDFDQWTFLSTEYNLPLIYDSDFVVEHDGLIYIGTTDRVYVSDQSRSRWSIYQDLDDESLTMMKSTAGYLVLGMRQQDGFYRVEYHDDGQVISAGAQCVGVPVDVIIDEQARVWYADLFARIRVAPSISAPCEQRTYPSPFATSVSDIVVQDGEVLVASGGVAENFTYLFSREGFYLYDSAMAWINFNELDDADIAALDLLSVYRVAFHPTQPKIYAGSYWAGLFEYDLQTNTYTLYNQENSTLRGTPGDPARERVTGLAFDDEENLWVATYGADRPINVLTAEGRWLSFDVPGSAALTDILIDELGYKWFTLDGGSSGTLIYDSGESLQNVGDDQYRYITTTNSALTSNRVLSMTMDLDGDVWVGTEEGPVVFNCGFDIMTDCPGVRIKVSQDSIVAFLLADQQINAITVDGANQKWFGTRNGLFVQSAQGDEQIAHFTEENSPLFDDEITALGYDGDTGEMWIGTSKGLISFRTKSTSGAPIHDPSSVYAYPNPVRPAYTGPIAIRGLVTDANVKITDVNGVLVAELSANGGQAVWDGLDQKGREVSNGVYLVFSIDPDAFDRPDAYVTKILVVR